MDVMTFNELEKLRDKFGSGPFGKIAQKLLALSFREIGYAHIVERSVQGVDIDIADDSGHRFALEVKTSENMSFNLESSNIQALRDREKDKYSPVIAALRLAYFEKWVLARVPFDELTPGQMFIDRLRAYRMKDMEELIEPAFARTVAKHFQGTLEKGQQYLDEQLKKKGIKVRDS